LSALTIMLVEMPVRLYVMLYDTSTPFGRRGSDHVRRIDVADMTVATRFAGGSPGSAVG